MGTIDYLSVNIIPALTYLEVRTLFASTKGTVASDSKGTSPALLSGSDK